MDLLVLVPLVFWLVLLFCFKINLFYLKFRGIEKEGDTEIFHLLVPSSDGHAGQGWTGLRPEAFLVGLPVGAGAQGCGPSIAFLGCYLEQRGLMWDAGSVGTLVARFYLLLLGRQIYGEEETEKGLSVGSVPKWLQRPELS